MPTTILQKVVFKNTTAKALYDLYMNAKLHSLIAGSPVIISSKPGAKFSAHGGYIKGRNISLTKNRQILQTWRAEGWDKNDVDSIFMINLEQKGKDAVLYMVHAFLPEKAVAGIKKGWTDHYWNPWKQHLAGKPITRPTM
jgi:activator of HSP90 ATPase